MFDLSLYGTAAYPLRPSGLSKLVRCGVQVIGELLADFRDESGVAADTGSVTHAAVEAFHRADGDTAKRTQAGLDAIQAGLSKFPKAEKDDARIYFAHYANDPRNQRAEIIALEQSVSFTLEPHESDPTRQPIVVNGKLDQIRKIDGRMVVNDIKTGQSDGVKMLHDYAYQLSAYLLGAKASGYPQVEGVSITRMYGYRKRGAVLPSPDGVFWFATINERVARLLLDRVRLEVARIRSGEVHFGPGEHCSWCPYKGIDRCVPSFSRKIGLPLA